MKWRVYKRASKKHKFTWTYIIELGKDQDGNRVREAKSGFRTKRKAEEACEDRAQEIKLIAAPASARQTLGSILHRYVDQHAVARCTPKTVERYRELSAYLDETLRETPLSELTPFVFEAEYERLRKSGGKRGGLAPKTVRSIHGLVHAALKKAVKWGLLIANPADDCDLPPMESGKVRALDIPEMKLFLDLVMGHWVYPIIRFASDTACRRGEILGLQWSDLNLDEGVASITRSLEQTREGLRIKGTKNNRRRDCPLPLGLLEILRSHREQQESNRSAYGDTYRNDLDLVFASPDGDFLKPDSVTATVCRLAKKAGLKGAGLHCLRHSHGSLLLSSGHSLPTVSRRLGHADPAITARVYSHSFTREEKEAARDWDVLMGAVDGKQDKVH